MYSIWFKKQSNGGHLVRYSGVPVSAVGSDGMGGAVATVTGGAAPVVAASGVAADGPLSLSLWPPCPNARGRGRISRADGLAARSRTAAK